MDLTEARVAITGASSGIGAATAKALAEQGSALAVSARREDRLETVADACRDRGAPEVRVDRVDVTDADAVSAWFDAIDAAWGDLDVVVANAGVGQYGSFLDVDADHLDRVMETNVRGVWRTVRGAAPLLEPVEGHAIVVASVVRHVPIPYMSAYVASKAAVAHWSRAVRPELARRGIDLTLVSPGATQTEFPESALKPEGTGYGELKEMIGSGWSAERVARAITRAARRRPKEVNLTVLGRLGMGLGVLAPNFLARTMEPQMRPPDRDP